MFERAGELRGYIDVLLRYSNRPFFLQVKLRAPGTGWARLPAAASD